jgi:hypothetical protein
MSGILPVVSISDVPENKVEKVSAVGVIGEVSTKEVKNGYVSVSVPITYSSADGSDRTFTARYNVKPEWFDAGFASTMSDLSDSEKISYQINMVRNTRGLFKAAGLDSMDFATLEGSTIGFTAGPQKNDPSRLELKGFYAPKK